MTSFLNVVGKPRKNQMLLVFSRSVLTPVCDVSFVRVLRVSAVVISLHGQSVKYVVCVMENSLQSTCASLVLVTLLPKTTTFRDTPSGSLSRAFLLWLLL